MLALEWLKNAHGIMEKLEATQLENIKKAATVMADSIEAGRWVTRLVAATQQFP
ncbi:SIS domain-containing protein [Bacteroides uniformis]|nr:SIS domain-containing protein [Bacteroides uniformis]